MPQCVIKIFIDNQIDGYSLLDLSQEDLEELFGLQQAALTDKDTNFASPLEGDELPSKIEQAQFIAKIMV